MGALSLGLMSLGAGPSGLPRRGGGRLAASAVLIGLGLAAAPPTAAEAAPSIESIKFVTVYNPPGGGTPIRRETPGPSSGAGLTQLDVDSDPQDKELTANVALGFDAAEGAVTGQLQITRTDFGGLLGPTTLPQLPVWVEAVAVLKDTVGGIVKRQNVAAGYDARASSAPGRFTLDIGSCSTPNCRQATPTTCTAPCNGTKTTLRVNVVAPGSSLKLTGELSKFASGGDREDPLRAEIDFSPVPGSSSPLEFTIWGTETKASDAADAPVATLTHVSMNGNKEALKATAHVCRLPGEVYQPKQVGDTACDAAGYTDQQLDSRIVDATLDEVPRDIATGNARVTVSVADNGLGRNGGLQTIVYDSTHPVHMIDVADHVVSWSGAGKREADRSYHLVDVPTWAKLEILDESDVAGTDDAIKKLQTATYDAGGRLTSVDFSSVQRRDGAVTKREALYLETVPTHLKVVAQESDEQKPLFGLFGPGFDRHTRQSVALAEASSPIGVIEYSTADGETSAAPPGDIGDAYVYTTKDAAGVQLTKLRLLGAQTGDFTLGRHEHQDAWNNPFNRPEPSTGLDLLSVSGRIAPTPFRTLAEDEGRVFDVRVNDLPGEIELTLKPEEGKIEYHGSAEIGTIRVLASDPAGLFERATSLDVLLETVPTDLTVQYPSGDTDLLDLTVQEGEIGKLELTALGDGDSVPADALDAETDGVIIRDLEGIEDVADAFVMFARVRGLRHVAVADLEKDVDEEEQRATSSKTFALDATAGRRFVVDSQTTGDVKEYIWEPGYGYDWSDEDSRCDEEVVDKKLESTHVVIGTLRPGTALAFDKRHSYGKRDCFENAFVTRRDSEGNRRRVVYDKESEFKIISYSAAESAGRLDLDVADGSTNLHIDLDPLPTSLRFCRSDGHDCLPDIGDGYGAGLGSLTLQASDYVTINVVDCKQEFEDGECGSANFRVEDLELKRIDFWGDKDGRGISGDLYMNTADWETGDNQPFHGGRIKADSINFKFGDGFYARGAHIYWDNIWDDEHSDWSPDGTGGAVHCPTGTHWQIDALSEWWDVTDDWCNSGEADS